MPGTLQAIRRMKNVLLLICMLLSLESKGQNQTSEESLNERLGIKPLAQSPAKVEFRCTSSNESGQLRGEGKRGFVNLFHPQFS